jgi:hypothetical protein
MAGEKGDGEKLGDAYISVGSLQMGKPRTENPKGLLHHGALHHHLELTVHCLTAPGGGLRWIPRLGNVPLPHHRRNAQLRSASRWQQDYNQNATLEVSRRSTERIFAIEELR